MIKEIVMQVTYECPKCGAEYCTGMISLNEWKARKACEGEEEISEGCGHVWYEALARKMTRIRKKVSK